MIKKMLVFCLLAIKYNNKLKLLLKIKEMC